MSTKRKGPKKVQSEVQPHFKVELTKLELEHLRDVLSVFLSASQTVSLQLASAKGVEHVDASLWEKTVNACQAAEIGLEDDAPTYVVTLAEAPQLGIFEAK